MSDALLAKKKELRRCLLWRAPVLFASGNLSPLLWLTQLAAQTERIRLGTSVICAPFHNPLWLAGDIAAIDIVSKGCFDLGIGVGTMREEAF